MLNKIKNFLSSEVNLERTHDGEEVDRELLVGIGVLMLQMAGADNDYAPEEIQSCFRSLERQFGISDEEAMKVLEEAEATRADPDKVSNLIEKITEDFNEEQRKLILALIWKVVVADEQIEGYELRIANQLRVRLQLSEEQAEEARQLAFTASI